MCLFSVGRPHFEELSFPIDLPVSFSTFDPEEYGVGKFSWLFFHLAPDEIHPLALLIPIALLFYYVFCIIVVVKRCCLYYSLQPICYPSSTSLKTHSSIFILHACHIKKGCHTSFMCKDSLLAPFFSHHFLILEEIWLIGEGVTTLHVCQMNIFTILSIYSNFRFQIS